jgi:hypothetical protein
MKLEDQVVSLDLAKRLKELGVRQDSHFWYVKGELGTQADFDDVPTTPDECVAFSVAELGNMLPCTVERDDDVYSLVIPWDSRRGLMLRYERSDGGNFMTEGDTEADARAKMLIYLIEQKLIPAPVEAETTSKEA